MKRILILLVFCAECSMHAQVIATKRSTLFIDTNGKGTAGAGDTLRYTIVITNTSATNIVNVQFGGSL